MLPHFALVVDTRISHFNLCCLAVKSGTVQLSACRAEYLCFVRRTCYSVRSLYVSVLLDPIFMGCQSNLYVRRLNHLSLSCTSDQFLGRQLKCHLEGLLYSVISYVFFVSGRKSHSRLLLFLLLNNSSLGVALFFSPSTHNNQTGKMYQKSNSEVDCRDSVFYDLHANPFYCMEIFYVAVQTGMCLHLCFRRTGPLISFLGRRDLAVHVKGAPRQLCPL